ncbi:MAG: hypothetical protein M1823_002290 [Watsoniomyces obsoletus]|nr:MAG: hypothetical protein M1823_002290 [Watsoniomyces obsoletus]
MDYDSLARLAPSLKRYENCDIIDVKPGIGLWSSKVHDLVKPRRHILIEEKKEFLPFLQPLLDQPGSRYQHMKNIHSSHIDSVNQVVTNGLLPEQEAYPEDDPRREQPNDTLLVLANLGKYSSYKLEYHIPVGVSHWGYLWGIQNLSLLRQYGQIRMLVWVNDEEKRMILPRCVANRTRRALQAEVWLEDIYEIAGTPGVKMMQQREDNLNMLSTVKVVKSMQERGVVTPERRKTELQQEAEAVIASGNEQQKTTTTFSETRFWSNELEQLQQAFSRGEFTRFENEARPDPSIPQKRTPRKTGKQSARKIQEREKLGRETQRYSRMRYLEHHLSAQNRRLAQMAEIVSAFDEMDPKDASSREAALGKLKSAHVRTRAKAELYLDDRKALLDDPPLLYWDRRHDEPLLVYADEFSPRQPLALLDLHPHPIEGLADLFRNKQSESSKTTDNDDGGNNEVKTENKNKSNDDPEMQDLFEFMLKHFFKYSRRPIRQVLGLLGDDAAEALIPECPSLLDPKKGSSKEDIDLKMMRVRMVRCEMLVEILQAWKKWPFRPDRKELLEKWAVLEQGMVSQDDYQTEKGKGMGKKGG